jgi:transcriptional regulator with XRE-family HTH domain
MSECAQIIAVLKRSLKARGTTYRDLAQAVGLSEASVKRIFSEETFSLARLEQICTALGLSIVEVAKMAAQQTTPGGQQLTIEQEQTLADDTRLLACFHLLINGHEPADIANELDLTERDLRRLLVKLDAVKLIELQPKMKVRLRTSNVIVWRSNGPVRRCRLDLHAAAAGHVFPDPGGTRRHGWTAGALVYQLVAFGMPDERFRAVAETTERATRGLPDEGPLREARLASRPCIG